MLRTVCCISTCVLLTFTMCLWRSFLLLTIFPFLFVIVVIVVIVVVVVGQHIEIKRK